MARPSAITPAVAALIEANREPGLSPRMLTARVQAAGVQVSEATIRRYLKRGGAPKPKPARATAPAAPEAAAAEAIESDDLGRLVAVRDAIDAALASWRSTLGVDGASVRAYAALARLHADVTARLVELRPRPEVEAERLEALGVAARAALLERAREASRTDEGLRDRLRRQQQVIDQLVDEKGGA